jgi:NAD(P)-dependent dehydrogenase (short-subunit alcohol dehydrogenase family)
MSNLRFDGRTAIVTGAGGNPSLGRAHALLLASRGANVVVNDIGTGSEMRNYTGVASADAVAAEIVAAGGNAVADTNSVATFEGAEAIIRTAIQTFGRIDILVNNAGITLAAPFDVMTPHDFTRQIDINLMGSIWTSRAAWPHMKAQGYGRILNTTSTAMLGLALQVGYAVSKGGLWSLTRSLAVEGGAHGIKVNAISPGAFTRMASATMLEDSRLLLHLKSHLPAELVSPVVAFLCHESCPVTGECIDSVGGDVYRTYVARTRGFASRELTTEMVADRWNDIMSHADGVTLDVSEGQTLGPNLKPYNPG